MNGLRLFAQRFARTTTNTVVRRPWLWRLFRGTTRALFDRLAPHWDEISRPENLAPLDAALATLPEHPRRVLDLGTGTGNAAVLSARRFPSAQVTGVDLSPEMVQRARANAPAELAERLRFDTFDAERLPFADREFDLVTLANMIPFFDELERLLAPGGHAAFSFSRGAETPIYVSPDRLRRELERRGFVDFADFRDGVGVALLARKRRSG